METPTFNLSDIANDDDDNDVCMLESILPGAGCAARNGLPGYPRLLPRPKCPEGNWKVSSVRHGSANPRRSR